MAGGIFSSRGFSACASSSEQGSGAQALQVELAVWPASLSPSRLFPPAGKCARSAGKDKVRLALLRGPARPEMSSGSPGTAALHPPPTRASQPAVLSSCSRKTGSRVAGSIRRSPSTRPQRLHAVLAASHTCRLTRGHKCTPTHACAHAYTCCHRHTLSRPPDTPTHARICTQAHTHAFL